MGTILIKFWIKFTEQIRKKDLSSSTLCFKSKKGAYKNQGRSITKKNSEIFGMFSQIFEMYVIQYNLIMNFVYLGQNEGRFRK